MTRRQPKFPPCRLLCSLMIFLLACSVADASSSNQGMIIRVRKSDGAMERLQIPLGAEDSTTLEQALSPLLSSAHDNPSDISYRIGTSLVKNGSQTISGLGLKNGSLVTIVPPKPQNVSSSGQAKEKGPLMEKSSGDRFDPFPDLAKDYRKALRRTKTRRASQGGMSFGMLADLQSSLHVVEPQAEGPLKRAYMCSISAERFQSNCNVRTKRSKESLLQNRVALLLGSVARERVDPKPKKARTSLSSAPSDLDYCNVAKVHALWEPPQTASSSKEGGPYDSSELKLWNKSSKVKRVLEIASLLGLRPVGWIFSYSDDRHKDEDALPVLGPDVVTGATLQISNMQHFDPENISDGSKCVTFAMDAKTGATEAFQLSDVSVQMVAEGLLGTDEGRFVKTSHAVLVDGKESTQLDSVLCLVNTAMLGHEGSFAGTASVNALKKNGTLTAKSKKRVLAALQKPDDSCTLLNVLSDFNLLVGLDSLMGKDDMSELCSLVRKWARGQKRGTIVGQKLRVVLQTIMEN